MNETLLEKSALVIGYVPLTDCATLIIAKEKGYFEKYGLDVTLSKEASWANIRDKLAYGILDAAQMLATMPIASTLGIGGWKKETIASMVLSINGNAITISDSLYKELKAINPEFDLQRPVTADTLKQYIEKGKSEGKKLLTFAHVFPASTHNYLLRYWLASAGIDPDNDIILNVIPPQQMVDNLEANVIDGFCAGEPWGQTAINKGSGHALITSFEIWNNAPDKVLGVNKEWVFEHPNTHKALLKALIEAACWIDDINNREETAEIISRDEYIFISKEIITPPMMGKYKYHPGGEYENIPDFNVFFKYHAGFPWHSHMGWFMSQMIRWGDIADTLDVKSIIKDIFWNDFYRSVCDELDIAYPVSNSKDEGVHDSIWVTMTNKGEQVMSSDLFFDGKTYQY